MKIHIKKICFVFLYVLLVLGNSSCITNVKSGLSPEYEGYISTRIATFPCQIWPKHLNFEGSGELNVGEDIQKQACQYFDDFIVEIFKNQPFVKGLSSNMTYKILEQNRQESKLDLSTVWKRFDGCFSCSNPQTLYARRIMKDPEWAVWLSNTSLSIKNADTILLPFITGIEELSYKEQGILIKRRALTVALLLIDTDNSKIIWSNFKKTDAAKKTFDSNKNDPEFKYTDWKMLYERVFTSQLFIDFPGRQIF